MIGDESNFIIRNALNNEEDCKRVFSLSNDNLVRANSFNSQPILYENHKIWYEKTVKDSNTLFLLVFDKENFVGQMRFTRKNENDKSCIVSLSITPEYRGRGISKAFLNLGIDQVRKNWENIISIDAEVKSDNIPSNKLFQKIGFDLTYATNHYSISIDTRK